MQRSQPAAAPLPPALEALAKSLAALSADERELVILAARGELGFRSVPWDELWKARGIAAVGGGDAVVDCDALYDDC